LEVSQSKICSPIDPETNEGGCNGKRRYPIVQKLWT
jgi:hypothetical protein